MRSAPLILVAAFGFVGCVHFPNAQLVTSSAAVEVVTGPVVCGPLGFRKVPLQSRWGEYVRVTVTAPSVIKGTALVHANGAARPAVEWSAEGANAVILDTRFENLDPDQRFALQREQPIDITLTGLEAVAGGTCEGAVFTVEHGALMPDIDERAWLAELERRGGPELAARREAARVEAEARRQAHYAAWEARQQVQVSVEVLAQADAIRQAHYAAWEARQQVEAGGAVLASVDANATVAAQAQLDVGLGAQATTSVGSPSNTTASQAQVDVGVASAGPQTSAVASQAQVDVGVASAGQLTSGVASQAQVDVGVASAGQQTSGVGSPPVDASGFVCAPAPAAFSVNASMPSGLISTTAAPPSMCPSGMVAVAASTPLHTGVVAVPPSTAAIVPPTGLVSAHVEETVQVNGTASSATEWSQPFDSGDWQANHGTQVAVGADVAWSQPTDAQLRGGGTVVAGAQTEWAQPSDAQLRTQPVSTEVQIAARAQPSPGELRTVAVSSESQAATTVQVAQPTAAVQVDVVTPALLQLIFDVAALGGAAPCPPPQPCAVPVHAAAPVR